MVAPLVFRLSLARTAPAGVPARRAQGTVFAAQRAFAGATWVGQGLRVVSALVASPLRAAALHASLGSTGKGVT